MTSVRIRLREWRTRRGLTQKQLAEAAGVRVATVGDLETGRHQGILFATLDALCAALDIEPADFFASEPPPEPAPVKRPRRRPPGER